MLKGAEIDVSNFSTHSVRGASVITNNILKAADWSSESVFQKFYYHSIYDPGFG